MFNACPRSYINNASYGRVPHFYRHAPHHHHRARLIRSDRVYVLDQLRVPDQANASLCPPQPRGLVAYDDEQETLCFTDNAGEWVCTGLGPDLTPAVTSLANPDIQSAMLGSDVSVPPAATPGSTYPLDTDFVTLTGFIDAPPRVSSTSFNPVTGVYTAPKAGVYLGFIQVSWKEGGSNSGMRVARLIHTAFIGGVRTTMIEHQSVPSGGTLVNTVQNIQIATRMEQNDTLHIEVAQTGLPAFGSIPVEGGGTASAAATSLTISQIAQPDLP